MHSLSKAIVPGPGGEKRITKLEYLAYYFIEAKEQIIKLVVSGNAKNIYRALTRLSSALPTGEEVKILKNALTNKLNKVRERALMEEYMLINKLTIPVILK